MSKRKKLRASGEGIRSPKPPKNLRLGDSLGAPPTSELGRLHGPEELEDSSGPSASAEPGEEDQGQAPSSCPEEETGAASRFLGPPDRQPAPLPASQSSGGRFVPQFARLRKVVTRKAEEALPEPSAQQAGSQAREESPGLTLQEARGLGDETQADGTWPEQSVQSPMMPGSGDSQPEVSPEEGTGPSDPKRSSQDSLPGARMAVVGNLGDNRPETDSGGRQGPGAQGGEAEADLPVGPQEAGAGFPRTPASPAAMGLETPSAAQDQRDWWLPSGEAERSCGSPARGPMGSVVTIDPNTGPPEPEHRAPEVAGLPASPGDQAPGGGHSRRLAGETEGGREEAEPEEEALRDTLGSPAAALVPGNPGPAVGPGDPAHGTQETSPGVAQTQKPSPDPRGPGGPCSLPVWPQPEGRQAEETGSQAGTQDAQGLSLSPGACGRPDHSDAAHGPPQGTRADASAEPAPQPQNLPDAADHAAWAESSAMELDFLPDSQIQDALDVPDLEAPPEQGLLPGSHAGLGWTDRSPRANRDLAEAGLRPHAAAQAPDARQMEDATDTVRGLVVELSNLNRLIMSIHRDLDAFRRLNPRKAKAPGKAPPQCPPKGPRSLPRAECGWRDL